MLTYRELCSYKLFKACKIILRSFSLLHICYSVMSLEKARQSSACWNGALNLPKQRLQTAVMAVESFLSYHAAHWTGLFDNLS